jgi:hypothetical protein
LQEQTKAHAQYELQEKGFIMSDYEEIMKSLVKFRDYCRKNSGCRGCEFEDFCELNLEDTHPFPNRWVFDGEEIICDEE